MERSGELLTRAYKVFFNLDLSNTNETIQKVEAEVAPKLSAHNDAIYLDPKLFARVKAIYDRRDTLGLDPEARYLVERYHLNFVRAGAQPRRGRQGDALEAERRKSRRLTTKFRDSLLADTNASRRRRRPEGGARRPLGRPTSRRPPTRRSRRRLEGKWVLPLQNTTQQPPLSTRSRTGAPREDPARVRERGDHGGDERHEGDRAAPRRAPRAEGEAPRLSQRTPRTSLDDQMAKTPANAEKLMTDLVPAADGEGARRGRDDAEADRRRQKGGFQLGARRLGVTTPSRVRKAEYDLDETQVRPYFELDRVLQDGVFSPPTSCTASPSRSARTSPSTTPTCGSSRSSTPTASPLALYYGDYFARPNKSGGAWVDSFVDQSRLLGTQPVVFNVHQLHEAGPRRAGADLSFDDVTTMFHEFGHALHGMLSERRATRRSAARAARLRRVPLAVQRALGAGAGGPRQLREALQDGRADAGGARREDPEVADLQPGLRDDGVPRRGPARHGVAHASRRDEHAEGRRCLRDGDAAALRRSTCRRCRRATTRTYFSHIWDGGYAAGYYAYLWTEVIDDDAYYWFKEHGGMTRANGDTLPRG